MLADGSDIENVLTFLRSNQLSKIDSIKVVRELMDLSLAEAKGMYILARRGATFMKETKPSMIL